ncbi:DUF1353 domain-containing protein [Pseudomonas sp. MOB-449]|nr:DUF1353 domain-containing protein [Pseudomonas sp. MOB-449]
MESLNLIPIVNPDKNKLDEAYEITVDIEVIYDDESIWVPKFFQYDGASIPSAAWQIIGTPFNPRFMVAAVFHDWLYHTHQIERDSADELLYELLLESGVKKTKATIIREAVKGFGGWYWDNDRDDISYIRRLANKISSDGRMPSKYGI